MTLTWPDVPTPPTGRAERFGGRWRLVAAGLSNVWRYGDLDLDAASGRLLLRGPNGTGKTTALELLWPYLLDLNPALLAAGKARNTHLSQLMRESAEGSRRIGFAWLTFAGPGEVGTVTYGVRLNYSKGGTPEVKVAPFSMPGRALHDVALWGPGRASLSPEQFAEHISAHGGTLFDTTHDYVRDLASRVFDCDAEDVVELARRIREVRNPALLGVVSPQAAAEALKVALPGVSDDIIEATGEALAESAATRAAFEADRAAAEALAGFARVWAGHAAEVTASDRERAANAVGEARRHAGEVRRLEGEQAKAATEAEAAAADHAALRAERSSTRTRLEAVEKSDAYRDAGRLNEVAANAQSLAATAEAKLQTLQSAATHSARLVATDQERAEDLSGDIGRVLASLGDDLSSSTATLLSTSTRHRLVFRVGDTTVSAGPALSVDFDIDAFDATVANIAGRAELLAREVDRAKLYESTHKAVAEAEDAADGARREAGRLATSADDAAKAAKAAAAAAVEAAEALSRSVADFATALPADCGWDLEDAEAVDWDNPAAALASAEHFADLTSAWAHRQAAGLDERAERLDAEAATHRADAAALRAEAAHIRDNDVLLALPRPDWAGPGDDDVAFGAAIDWSDGTDTETQDIIEATLAAADVLGATLGEPGARTATWAVDTAGPSVGDRSLAAVLRPDPDHHLAEVAGAVLERITLVDSALDTDAAGLVIGRDGTFRAGVLAAAVPSAQVAELRRPAAHIGARRRRDAALAHADELDARADELHAVAVALEVDAAAARDDAETALELPGRFPRRDRLRDAESTRTATAAVKHRADEPAQAAERHADELANVAAVERRQWVTDVTGAGLPPEVAKLADIVADGTSRLGALTRAEADLRTRLRPQAIRTAESIADNDMSAVLDEHHAEAVAAHEAASAARDSLDELRDQIGRSAEEALERHRTLSEDLAKLGPKVSAADRREREAGNRLVEVGAKLEAARSRVAESEPAAAREVAALRELLALPGVAEAVLAGAEPDADDRRLLTQVETALKGARMFVRKTLRERADETQARLAGVWSLDPGVDHPRLDTYSLTHGPTSHTPLAAADHAQLLATKAEEALRAADAAALENFVVGRLPAAIAEAWTRLHDWVRDVNRKMGSATASSGVGVTVHVSVRDDLPAVARTVYELACKTGAALRDNDAKAEAGRAIHQLINAADGDDMAARVRAAVNVRDWVDVTYRVVRPGEDPRTWNSRTGLSGGERRLVVLAPMLAAVAAAYDRFGDATGRVVALDEIPSEVDEAGREGLARYIAELDLDLIATSHHWDGAPGAWDGIDAHDLEAAPDGTVVSFPMLVRGLKPLPGDQLNPDGLPAV